MADKEYFSPAEVAQALGVSATTIKRWVDAGILPAHKTAGGHRKILLADVLRLAREGNFPHVELDQFGLALRDTHVDTELLCQQLFDALRIGDISRTRAVIHGAHAARMSIENLGDEIIAPAMTRLGREWESGRIQVMHEHRATLLCTAVLHELKPALEENAEAKRPVAVGGNPEGDHSSLGSLLVQMVLLDAGWEAVNLGPHTPLASFQLALRELQPRLMWLSASHVPDPWTFLDEYRQFYEDAERAGVAVAIGGRALQSGLREKMPYTFYGDGLIHLAAFARTLHPRPLRPKRGRPMRRRP